MKRIHIISYVKILSTQQHRYLSVEQLLLQNSVFSVMDIKTYFNISKIMRSFRLAQEKIIQQANYTLDYKSIII